ncbi:hypothetical protein NDU88_003801 [Pleurodeles waltl]|uniref:Uncharacterized protein n=1 Tax=Pleurodeles waltl TaxID=8319 RepID=A0AAV7V3F1_PLEWA|nr:hypothetical protein NDU88_003801 [Pleurodeles waltl]
MYAARSLPVLKSRWQNSKCPLPPSLLAFVKCLAGDFLYRHVLSAKEERAWQWEHFIRCKVLGACCVPSLSYQGWRSVFTDAESSSVGLLSRGKEKKMACRAVLIVRINVSQDFHQQELEKR